MRIAASLERRLAASLLVAPTSLVHWTNIDSLQSGSALPQVWGAPANDLYKFISYLNRQYGSGSAEKQWIRVVDERDAEAHNS